MCLQSRWLEIATGCPHAREKCEEGRAAERSYDGLTVAPIPLPLLSCSACVGRGRVGMMEWSLAWARFWRCYFIFFCLCSSQPKVILINNKLNQYPPSQICFVCSGYWSDVYLAPWAFLSHFLPLSCWGEQMKTAGWASGTWMRSSHHNTTYFWKILGTWIYRQPNIFNIIVFL